MRRRPVVWSEGGGKVRSNRGLSMVVQREVGYGIVWRVWRTIEEGLVVKKWRVLEGGGSLVRFEAEGGEGRKLLVVLLHSLAVFLNPLLQVPGGGGEGATCGCRWRRRGRFGMRLIVWPLWRGEVG